MYDFPLKREVKNMYAASGNEKRGPSHDGDNKRNPYTGKKILIHVTNRIGCAGNAGQAQVQHQKSAEHHCRAQHMQRVKQRE